MKKLLIGAVLAFSLTALITSCSSSSSNTNSPGSGSNNPPSNPPGQSPTADLMASPTRGQAPLTVNFTITAKDPDGGTVQCTLDFGDGQQSDGCSNQTHVYASPGTYQAVLRVTDDESATAEDRVSITVLPSSSSEQIRVTVPGAGAAAYRIDGSTWLVISDPTSFSLDLESGNKYDIAVLCPYGEGKEIIVLSLTRDDLENLGDSSLRLGCNSPPRPGNVSFTVNYDVRGLSRADGIALGYKYSDTSLSSGPQQQGSQGTVNGWGLPGEQDLILVAYSGSEPIAAKVQTVTIEEGGTYTITLSNGDPSTHSITRGTFPSFSGQVPSGWKAYWTVYAITPRLTDLNVGYAPGAEGGSFYKLPGIASYYISGVHAYLDDTEDYQYLFYLSTFPDTPPAEIDLPDPIDFNASGNPLTYENLPQLRDLIGYLLMAVADGLRYEIIVSKDYLSNSTTYTLPDLTSLRGFEETLPEDGTWYRAGVLAVGSDLQPGQVINRFLRSYGEIPFPREAYLRGAWRIVKLLSISGLAEPLSTPCETHSSLFSRLFCNPLFRLKP